jgi:hypothetical protein
MLDELLCGRSDKGVTEEKQQSYRNIDMIICFYLYTVHIVTFTLLKKTNSCTYFNTFIFTLKQQKDC